MTTLENSYDIAKTFDFSERVEDSIEIREAEADMHANYDDRMWIPPEELDDDLSDIDPNEPRGHLESNAKLAKAGIESLTPAQKVR